METLRNTSQVGGFNRPLQTTLNFSKAAFVQVTWQQIAAAVAVYVFSLAFYRLYLHPLSDYPGPKLAAVTRWYEAYYDLVLGGQYTFRIAEMHKKYGPIIRISPYELHVSDPAFFEKIFRQDGRWDKYAWSYDAFGAPLTAVATSAHDLHRRRRAPVNSFFSKQNVTKRIDTVKRQVDKFCARLDGFAGSEARLNLNIALAAFARDAASDFMLGKCYGNLDQPDFNADMTKAIGGLTQLWMVTKHFRWVGGTLMALPVPVAKRLGGEGNRTLFSYLDNTLHDTAQLMAQAKSEHPDPDAPHTLVHAIVQSNLPEPELRHRRVAEEVASITGAGFESTAAVMRVTLFHIYSSPAILGRLRRELRSSGYGSKGAYPADLDWTKLQQLPYLTGVLHEGLRLSPGLASRMARVAPDRDLFYGDRWRIPAGTPVGMTTILMHYDEQLYPEPKRFAPERWTDVEKRKKAEKTYAPFSRGTRSCLGMHLAWSELYMIIASVVLRFDLKFDGAGPKDWEPAVDQFTIGTKDQSGIQTWVARYEESS
ncbi:cytochrome P450 [Apiospora aurea]|uniref:Cytochrome P450 n=1 Tax=Apiospora aurea TaxID=335848 RepID=A0ABR1PSB1_9PEZI